MAEKILVQFEAQGLDGLTAELAQASNAQEQFNAEITQTEQGTKKLTTQLRQMQDQLAKLAVAGKQNTDEYKKLREEAGKLKDAMQDASQVISQAGSDTRGLDKAIRATSTLVGGFAAIQGAAALFGSENENLQKSLLKVNAAMSVLAGLQQIQAEYLRDDSIFTEAASKAKLLYARAVGTATGAMKLFRLAVIATGLGALIVVLGTIAANWDRIKKAITENFPALAKVGRFFSDFQSYLVATGSAAVQFFKGIGDGFAKLFDKDFSGAYSAIKNIPANMKAAFKTGFAKSKEAAKESAKEGEDAGKIIGAAVAKGFEESFAANSKKAADAAIAKLEDELSRLDATTDAYFGLRQQIALLKEQYDELFNAPLGDSQTATAIPSIIAATVGTPEQQQQGIKDFDSYLNSLNERLKANNIEQDRIREEQRQQQKIDNANLANDVISKIGTASKTVNDFIGQIYQTRLNNLKVSLDQGLISEKEYAQEVAKIQEKQAKQAKAQAIIESVINSALALTKLAAKFPPPSPQFFAGLGILTALTAAQIAVISKQKIPQAPGFKKGVIDLKGEGTETSDSIHARLSRGESVMTAEETKKHKEVLWAIRKKTFDRKFIPVDEAMKRHRPMAIPASVGKMSVDSDGRLVSKLDAIYEELVYQNIYTKEGNRTLNKAHQDLSYIKQASRYGIRV